MISREEITESELAHCVECGKTHPPRAALIPSPFPVMITQGLMPTASETAAIRHFVREADAEIAWREHAIDRLHCELAELRRRSELHKAIIAPIRRVPPEIMAEIFLQLAAIEARSERRWDYHNDRQIFEQEYTSRPFPNSAPLIFGAICHEWRAIALSIPSLWNCIFLECTNQNMQNNVSLCNMWLKRSGALPLSIQFHRSDPEDVAPRQIVDDYRDLLRTILPYAQRWRVLDLKKFPASSYDTFHILLPNLVPMLETVSVSHDWREQPTLTSTPWAGLRISPKLRFLYFDSIGSADIMVGGERPTFPWSQLTHIDVGDCSAYDCLRILSEASTAVACRFVVQRPSFLQHPPISHPGLQTLKIEVHDAALPVWDLLICLDLLTCSTLSTLSVEARTMAAGPYLRGLPSFLTRSGATIQHFRMRPSGLDDPDFMSCLSAMPQLRSLDIAETFGGQTQFTEQVWESLTWAAAEDSPAPLVPNLESFTLDGDFNFSHKFVVRMLNSRVQTADRPANFSPKLKAVTLVMWRDITKSVYRRLSAFRELGLDMLIDVTGEDGEDEGSEASDAEDWELGDGDTEDSEKGSDSTSLEADDGDADDDI